MSHAGQTPKKDSAQVATSLALAGLLGQVGCLTFVIVLGAILAGLWIDTRFDTRPLFTLVLVLGSVPVTLYLMFRIVLAGAGRLQGLIKQEGTPTEEGKGGENP